MTAPITPAMTEALLADLESAGFGREDIAAVLLSVTATWSAEIARLREIESAARAVLTYGRARYDDADGATQARVIQAARAWAAARDAAWADFAPGPQMRAYEDAGDVLAATVAVMDRRVDDEGHWVGDLVPAEVMQALMAAVHGEQAAVVERIAEGETTEIVAVLA